MLNSINFRNINKHRDGAHGQHLGTEGRHVKGYGWSIIGRVKLLHRILIKQIISKCVYLNASYRNIRNDGIVNL